ncbi:MAG: hypothetical protein J6C52_07005, partial [Clostridia bacterium]|nr:hypothetical protein [Clostridia bacterium]
LTESLLSELSRFCRDIDGRLYAVSADRGTDAEAGDSYITILPGKADTFRVIRTTMVMDTCHGASYSEALAYPAAQSQTELMLVREDGRWVFADFADRDDLSDLESGGGMKFVHAREVAMAYLAYESAKSGSTRETLDRYMKFYRENPDGSATFTMQIDEDPHDALPGEEREFTAVKDSAGVWQIIDTAALPAVEPREAMILTGTAIPSEADVLQAYNHALDIWLDSHGDMLDYHHDEAYRRDRMYLLRQYATRADIFARLRESFTEALAAEILNRMFESVYAYYAEIDGRVYVSDIGIGGNERAGAAVCEVTAVDENTVKLSRLVHVCSKPADPVYDYFWLPVGVSVQELTLVREDGRWVFANFMDSDDIAAYDAGQGTTFAHSMAVAAAFLDAEKASGVTMPEGYKARRSMKTYCEHADGTATFTMLIDVFADGQYREAEREYTAVQNAAGEWEIVDFVAPGTIAAALLRGDTVLVPLTDAAIPSEADALRLIAHASILEGMQLETLAADKTAPAVDSYYYPVRDYPTLAALKARLCECFSAAYAGRIVDWMLATAYREIDGRLYVTEASGGLNELGECRITGVERIDDRTALIHREKEVYDRAVYEDAEIFDVIYYIAGISPQTLMMVYEDGRWVLDDFTPWYDESAYMEGGGMRIEGAAEIAEAFLAAEHAPAALTLDASRIFEWSYTELADIRRDGDRAVVTAEIRVKEKGYFYDFTQENIAVKTADGWEFEAPFISPSLAATIGLLIREAPAPTPKAGNFVPCTDPAVPSAEEIVRLAEHAARAREDHSEGCIDNLGCPPWDGVTEPIGFQESGWFNN